MLVGEVSASDARTFIDVDELVFADDDDIAIIQVLTTYALGFDVDAVGAVQILDDAGLRTHDELTVMPTHKAAVDLQVIISGAPDDDAPDVQWQLTHGAALSRHQHAS